MSETDRDDDSSHRVLHVRNQAHPLEHARSIVEIAAFVIAAGWGVYTFTYQEILKPARSPAALNCSVSMTHVTLANGDEFVTVSLTDENVGKTYVDVAAENVTVWGRAVGRTDAHVNRHGNAWETDRSRALGSKRLLYEAGELRDAAVAGRRSEHFDLAPDAKASEDYSFVVPRGRFGILDVTYEVWYLRADYGEQRVDLMRRTNRDGSSSIALTKPTEDKRVNRDNGETAFPL